MILVNLLSSSNYIIVNKDLIKILGLNEAVILGELCSEYNYWESNQKLEKDNYFYSTRENIEKNTGINTHFQKSAFKNLEEKGIIHSKKKGIPCKKYYKINEEMLIKYLEMAKIPVGNEITDKENTTLSTTTSSDELHDKDVVLINNNNINNKNNNNNNKEHTHEKNQNEEKNEYAKKVFMTEKEFNDLVKTYGNDIANQLIEQLSLYKQAKGKNYESDYAAILYWVTERIREIEKKDAKYQDFKSKEKNKSYNKNNNNFPFNQREYPPGFFDFLYCNT